MGRIEQLAESYGRHIAMPWQRTVSGAQRVIMIVYDKELERTLAARRDEFRIATQKAGHQWLEVDITESFAEWMADEEYREAYFESPDDLQLKLEVEFAKFVADKIRAELEKPEAGEDAVVAVFGVGSLFGFTRVSRILKILEPAIKGRLAIFFPGSYDNNNYRLLDARDGWNYLAVPITLHGTTGYTGGVL
jgi:hypothetical protein